MEARRRRKRTRRHALRGSEENQALRTAWVSFEETEHHVGKRNCKRALDWLVKGAKALDLARPLKSEPAREMGREMDRVQGLFVAKCTR